jgi:ABC-type transporter Mla subunit MlaD
MTRRRPLVIGLVAVTLAAGCGGSDGGGSDGGGGEGESQATEWAGELCSATVTWNESIRSAVDSLGDGNLGEEEVQGALEEVEGATSDFVDDLRGLGEPGTEAGQEAEESLDQLADDVEESMTTIRSAVDDASGASGAAAAATTVATTLSTLADELTATFDELEGLDGQGELESAFRQAESCDELDSAGL